MNFRFLIITFFFVTNLFGQNYTLRKIYLRGKQNNEFIQSPPFIDKDGFLWYQSNINTNFYKYDGKNTIKYSVDVNSNKEAFLYTYIHNWIQDDNGKIWAINLNGAYIISPDKFEVTYIEWVKFYDRQYETHDKKQIFSIKDQKGNIWISIGTDYVLKFDKNYKSTKIQNPALHEKYIQFQNKGLNSTLAKGESFDHNLGIVKVVTETSNGKILAQSYSDFYLIDDKGMQQINNPILSKEKKLNYYFVKNGEFFKKNTSGFYFINDKKYPYSFIKELDLQVFLFPFDNFLLADNSIVSVLIANKIVTYKLDSRKKNLNLVSNVVIKKPIINESLSLAKNSLIIFSAFDEIYLLENRIIKFKKYLQFKDNQISTRNILSDKKGNLYVGSYSGLHKIAVESNSVVKNYKFGTEINFYNALFLENDSTLWSGVELHFIKALDLKTNKITDVNHNGEIKYSIRCIKPKSADSFWLGTSEGLYVFDKKSKLLKRFKTKETISKGISVYDVLRDANRNLWIAAEDGLYIEENKSSVLNYNKIISFLKNEIITVLHEDKEKNIWIGTLNKGLILYNPKNGDLSLYNTSNGLSNNNICGILESKEGLWFSTYFGLSLFKKKTKKFANFYTKDGISDNEFNRSSFLKANDSTFFFGGLNGLTAFDPRDFNYSEKGHKIFLSKSEYYSIEKKRNIIEYLKKSEEIKLPYDKNSFIAEFTINDVFDKASKFLYKIDGLTKGWIDVGADGRINLYNLPPGKHSLTVKAFDGKGIETENKVKIEIYVEQIFYKTPWFLGSILFGIIALTYYLFRKRLAQQKAKYEKEREIIVLKQNALKAQMNPHFIFNILNNIQSVMFLQGELEANKYFGAFSKLMRLTLDISKQELVNLKDEIDYINYYLMLCNLQMNGQLKFFIKTDIDSEDQQSIFIPVMIVQPFVENAVIHGLAGKKEDKTIKITCFLENNYLMFHIEDNGIGREASALRKINKNFSYKSWSTRIVNERIEIFNSTEKDKIMLEIVDLSNDGESTGTQVILKFKML